MINSYLDFPLHIIKKLSFVIISFFILSAMEKKYINLIYLFSGLYQQYVLHCYAHIHFHFSKHYFFNFLALTYSSISMLKLDRLCCKIGTVTQWYILVFLSFMVLLSVYKRSCISVFIVQLHLSSCFYIKIYIFLISGLYLKPRYYRKVLRNGQLFHFFPFC